MDLRLTGCALAATLACCAPAANTGGDGPSMDAVSAETGPDAAPDALAPGDLAVSLSSPTDTAYVRDTVTIQAVVQGGTPDAVLLLRDGMALTTLTAPYQYVWDTRAVPEASYTLTVQATRAGRTFTSSPRTVVVDRTPPQVMTLTPAPGSPAVDSSLPVTVLFTEPVLRSTLTPSSVALTATPTGGAAAPVASTPSLDAAGSTLTIAPTGQFARPSTLAVALDATITDRAGNALVPLASPWSWTVPPWFFAQSTRFSANTSTPTVLLDTDARGLLMVSPPFEANSTAEVTRAFRLVDGALTEVTAPATPTDALPYGVTLLRVDPMGRAHLAMTARPDNTHPVNTVLLWRLDGDVWTALPRYSLGAMQYELTQMTFDAAGNPRFQLSGTAFDFVQLTGGTWSPWLPSLTPAMDARFDPNSQTLVQTDDGSYYVPTVVITEPGGVSSYAPTVYKLTGTTWTPVTAPPFLSGPRRGYTFATRAGTQGLLDTILTDDGVQSFARWDGAAWHPIDGFMIGTLHGGVEYQSFRTDRVGRPIFVAFAIYGNNEPRISAVLVDDHWVLSAPLPLPLTPMTSVSNVSMTADANNNRWIGWAETHYSGGANDVTFHLAREN